MSTKAGEVQSGGGNGWPDGPVRALGRRESLGSIVDHRIETGQPADLEDAWCNGVGRSWNRRLALMGRRAKAPSKSYLSQWRLLRESHDNIVVRRSATRVSPQIA